MKGKGLEGYDVVGAASRRRERMSSRLFSSPLSVSTGRRAG